MTCPPKKLICTLFTGQTSKEGIFMKYSYEYKKECIKMYREGQLSKTPLGTNEIIKKKSP